MIEIETIFNLIYLTKGGYDSDVQREKNIDYDSKTYANSIRRTEGTKPHMKADNQEGIDLK